jgi:hypothetical protein
VTAVDAASTSAVATLTVLRSAAGGLILAMGFEETTGTTVLDHSGQNNHGVMGAGVTRIATGSVGAALRFNGASTASVTVPHSASLGVTGAFTVSADVRPLQAITDFRAILVKNYDYFLYAGSAGYCGVGMPLGGFEVIGASYVICQPLILPVNALSQIAVTFDGFDLRWYRAGLLVSTQPAIGPSNTGGNALQIGASQFGENFVGDIDQVRVYSRALNQSEIQADINASIGTLTSGIVVKMGPLSKQVYGPAAKEVFGVPQ